MTSQTYEKELTANDTGETGAHQAGVHIPKSQTDLLSFLPPLDPSIKNPDAWLEMKDDAGVVWRFRYIHYNNSLHDPDGTRDEFRITHMTGFFRSAGARAGDTLVLSGTPGTWQYDVSVRKPGQLAEVKMSGPVRIRLRGWQRVY
jgi:hypothetical protein